ncbi:hypothetical protein QYF52_25660 [Paenibacillus polymyxa]|uniref:hypothetical protein n=1 Tax=Paenibacillus polymyxa TaxID=1406 RepID=UPI0025B7348F|nr:hypothetical protein [Paenibacillus polymyxa]MDN4081316.1 hypothetical protein [Paenibacillus polymyxa]MDN4116958.1 hypothetical protein [Paenibacillus polymyxa]
MQTIIGAALLWLLGNTDLIKLLASFVLAIGAIHTAFSLWHIHRRGEEYERF